MEGVQELQTLFGRAKSACDDDGVDMEQRFIALLEYLKQHPELRQAAEARFIAGLDGDLCWELISFCMHSLRYDAVREACNQQLHAADDPRDWSFLNSIIDSFGDDWEDRDLYDYYDKEGA